MEREIYIFQIYIVAMLTFVLSVSFSEVSYFFSNQLGHFWWIDLIWNVKCQSLSRVQLCNPIDYSPWGFSVHGIFQARILEKVPTLSRGSPLLQGVFLTQGLNPCLLHCRCILYLPSFLGSIYALPLGSPFQPAPQSHSSTSSQNTKLIFLFYCDSQSTLLGA